MTTIGRPPRRFLFRGEMRTVREIEAITGMNNVMIYRRVSGDRVLEGAELHNPDVPPEPRSTARLIRYAGRTLCAAEWARELNMPVSTFHSRLERGWTMHEIVTTPIDMRSGVNNRNRRIIRDITRQFRSYRNHQIFDRITTAFHPIEGGYDATLAYRLGTGTGSSKTVFDPSLEKIS